MGQTEAPLTIRPYLPRMTESELMTVMTSGMAHISGGIMAAYILFGIEAQHLLTAVIMTAPGTLMMAKIFVPETEVPETMGTVKLEIERTDVNVIDAAGRGTGEGLALALNVGAMLISFLALVALVNSLLGLVGPQPAADLRLGVRPGRLEHGRALGDAPAIGNLLGTRMALNEFVAYSQLGPMKAGARSALVHDRDVRAVRLRELQLDRHPDRRHRRAGADAPARPGAPRAARDAGRHARQLHHRDDRRASCYELTTTPRVQQAAESLRGRIGEVPDVAVVLGSGLGDFAVRASDNDDDSVWRDSALAGLGGRRSCRDAGGRAPSPGSASPRSRGARTSTRGTACRRRRSRPGCWACSACGRSSSRTRPAASTCSSSPAR